MSEVPRQQKITRLRGFRDLVGNEAQGLTLIEDHARAVVERYNFAEIRLPLLERMALYERSTGETSDIVQKQMYVFHRREESDGEGAMVLRPEGTPGAVRAYIEQGLDKRDPEQRFFYSGPMFRYERPQKGRYRQFHQFGVEVFGRPDAACDAELIVMIDDLRKQLGLTLETQVNSLGDSKCRPAFREAVLQFGRAHLNELCVDCRQRLERNPLRLLDCKIDSRLAESAPKSWDYLCDDCRRHFNTVLDLISKAQVPYVVNHRLVRGLDYYTRTTFEVVSLGLGAQNTVVAGGRYDGLVSQLGGNSVPGTGYAIGVERMAEALEAQKTAGVSNTSPDLIIRSPAGTIVVDCKSATGPGLSEAAARLSLYADVFGSAVRLPLQVAIVAQGEAALAEAFGLAGELRRNNLRVELLSPERRIRALLERAHKMGAQRVLIVGGDEALRGVVQLRSLGTAIAGKTLPVKHDQREVPRDQIVPELLASLRR